MKKTITLVLAAVLAFSLIGPASAKKKKPKPPPAPAPVELQFFMRVDEACDAPFLSLTDGEDGDCLFTDGGLFDVYDVAGLDTVRRFAAADGLPLTLDPTRKVVGEFEMVSYHQGPVPLGAGNAELDLTLRATIAGEEKVLGEYSESYLATPGQVQTVKFEMELDPALAGAVVEEMTLDMWSHGLMIGGRDAEYDATPAFIKIPAIK